MYRSKKKNGYVVHRLSYVEFDHELTSDELLHFKYISKKKVNGKWRYYYDKATSALEDLAYDITEPFENAKENFEWGYKLGNKRDSGGGVLNKHNAKPKTYAKLARTSEKLARYYDRASRGSDSVEQYKHYKNAYRKELQDMNESWGDYWAAKSVSGKIGQSTGRTVRKIQHNIEKGRKWLKKKFN